MSAQIIDPPTSANPIAIEGVKGSNGVCHGCRASTFLLPLHGARGGPLRCPLCIGKWHAEHGRRRRHGRIVIRALRAFLDNGGRVADVDKLKQSAISDDFLGESFLGHEAFADPLGYLTGAANTKGETIELTSELLADAITLAHPDHHPPEREELAYRTTQGLLAIKPFVFPAPKPKPPPKWTETAPSTSPPRTSKEPSRSTYPCADCRDTVPYFYCDPCKAEWDKQRQKEREREAAKQRKAYARRRELRLFRTPATACAVCGVKFKGKREDARFCSDACRQKAHRKAVTVTDKNRRHGETLISRDSLWQRGIIALIERHSAVFLNELLPRTRTPAQYQALCLVARKLEADGKISSIIYWSRIGRPGFKLLVKPGYDSKSHPIPRLRPNEKLGCTPQAAEVQP
jgi:hypothetical protein